MIKINIFLKKQTQKKVEKLLEIIIKYEKLLFST